MKRVIVFGASGVQGAAQVRALVHAGHTPIAVSRSPKSSIAGQQIETIALDFNDNDGLTKALDGPKVVFLNLPSTSFQPGPPIIAAAEAIGKAAANSPSVKLIVFNTSMPVPEECQNIQAQDDRRKMRTLLRASGVPVISIQPVAYLDNLLEGWALPPIRDRHTVVYCHKPDLLVSWICHDDLAKLMIAAMDNPSLAGRNIPVGGRETVVLEELAAKLSKGWGIKMKHENQTVADFCDKISKTMQGRGLDTEKIVNQMFKAYTYYNEVPEFRIDMGPVLKELPVQLTLIEDWARTHPVPSIKNE
ncbi:hypothetical protein LTR10_018710 [Elasticomyces elasticus]|uniref:NmrA-like domain-containing protein n=1 Tax=Exophiala sideris TaxID=1016849 RepID=A0ABR0JAR4_9EURO|nr:hypothetical protein LTR10_018710 [Elasticomyces elasticus]KAK5026254.1 hypothetical protein LTS07_007779 [Exophiala sideris]KAK5032507.1 hypothetical protein LTR13_007330 [Exophiala sideris]KAK5059666.1 hypothetical protein LTR69_006255 [Exophiala sideris]KAK5178051.1 hypothetical protein LTR44_009357 [Eurotiomycetes sp. CCFEE 6388]